jgi:UDP-2,3-diacylglucosamine pyrophosphatase LpxH
LRQPDEIIIYPIDQMNFSMDGKGAYIIVSDIHLGSEKCNQKEFCDFLEWVHSLANQSKVIRCKDKEVTIRKPDKLILLGDIMELWGPKDSDRDYVIKDCMKPFSLLSKIGCDKIYVVGNHDDSLGELDVKIDFETLENGTKFDIYNRHYPEKDEKSGIASGIKIGNKSYFFLHGHQFDKEQAILKYVSQLTGEDWNPLDWFQALYNIPFTKNHWLRNFIIFWGFLLGGGYLLLKLFRRSSFWNTVVRAMTIGFLALTVWATTTGFFALSSIPGIVANTQGSVYKSMKPRDKTAEQIITNKYYQRSKDTIDADVVVFGHTHFASSYELKSEARNKLFLNSGCWVGKDDYINLKKRYTNTFIYLDESGAYILTWRGSGKIECIEAF